MLVSLAKVGNETQKAVIRRLFQLGDVNTRADQVSHVYFVGLKSVNTLNHLEWPDITYARS